MSSLFTKIIERQLPATIVFENEHVIAIKDIHPVAPVHILVIPKKEIPSIQFLKKEDLYLMEAIILAVQEIADKLELTDYRLVTNNGADAGQSIFHMHFHLIGGKKLKNLA
ncbi:MAG: HIT domain-containing protein [Chlamydiota bacterium]